MEALRALPSTTQLSKTVVRILGQNPGPYTLQGTNTYLVGERNPYILIDTGEGKDAYIPLLEAALRDASRPHAVDRPYVSDIILTHKHHDHTFGLPSVLDLLKRLWATHCGSDPAPYQPPRIHKYPLTIPDTRFRTVLDTLSSIPSDSFTPDSSGNHIHELRHGQTLDVTTVSATPTSVLEVLHTPGHTTDSLCLYYPTDRALFTADTVLGHGSTVFEDLRTYMSSLRTMIDFSEGGAKYGPVYPGHGPVVEEGLKHVSGYLQNRQAREDQIVQALQSLPSEEYCTTWTLVSAIYKDYPRELWDGAARSVDMHLRKLEADNRVVCHGGDGKHMEWELV
ncbi:hypothetical protein POSPLADRAFT_1044314 [Postia placenta MAD-698-R-SB12]|uniref:Metallo-beta-lactamase domain-containing protein n=1 Tax=Postia placenta MAD-698-R-SB12 TaxID=670580 RepID=A0A1X6N898_9APHY|nr:hypothetical protein POSPLADRAFT_1044314 [Postia placenta MAD-698-R-SB12]OSX64869.1 hypothetical protein POSPLADRAFT_1044314 [Postia placenta MAD-698-R-SB12]